MVVLLLACLILGLDSIVHVRSESTKEIERMIDYLSEELKQMENVDVIDRVKEELNQLEIKKQKLTEFITSKKFTTLSDMHKFLLKKQLEVQILYIDILEQRLALFEVEK